MKKTYRFWILSAVLLALLVFGLSASVNCVLESGSESIYPSISHALMLPFYAYARDHNGKYPEGKTSTEVFQMLLDQGYLSDTKNLYVDYPTVPNKVPPTGKTLKAENICWDVTSGADSSSADKLPIIFFTGYKVSYQHGAPATLMNRTWLQWWSGLIGCKTFAAVGYKDGSSNTVTALENGNIPNFIPADFDPKGKTYRQLTP